MQRLKKTCVYILWFPFPWFYCFYVNSPRTFQVICLEAAATQQSKSWENNEKCAGKIHIKALETWKWKQQIHKSLIAQKKKCLPSTCIYVFQCSSLWIHRHVLFVKTLYEAERSGIWPFWDVFRMLRQWKWIIQMTSVIWAQTYMVVLHRVLYIFLCKWKI